MLDAIKQKLEEWSGPKNPFPGLGKAKSIFRKTRAKFYDDFADSVADGANPYDLFTRRYERARARRNRMAPLYGMWRSRAKSMNLHKTWSGTVPPEDLMIIGAGERGNLPEALRFLARVVTVRNKNRSVIVGAITLPVVLLIVLLGIQLGIALGVMPIMAQIMPPEKFPLLGGMLYSFSNYVLHYWMFIYGIPIVLIILFFFSLRRWTGPIRTFLDRFPPYAIYRDVVSSEFLVSLAALTEANMSIFDAVSMMIRDSSPWLRRHLTRIRYSLRSKRSVIEAMDTGLFSDQVFDRIAEYSERSNFEKGIRKIGLTTIEEVADMIEQRSTVIRNLLIVMVGGFILFTVASMLQIGQAAGEFAQSMV